MLEATKEFYWEISQIDKGNVKKTSLEEWTLVS